jgi:hypothetical protein
MRALQRGLSEKFGEDRRRQRAGEVDDRACATAQRSDAEALHASQRA